MCVNAAVLHVQQAFVLLLDAALFVLPLRPFPQKTCRRKTLPDMKTPKKKNQPNRRVASPSNRKQRISIAAAASTEMLSSQSCEPFVANAKAGDRSRGNRRIKHQSDQNSQSTVSLSVPQRQNVLQNLVLLLLLCYHTPL